MDNSVGYSIVNGRSIPGAISQKFPESLRSLFLNPKKPRYAIRHNGAIFEKRNP